MKEKKKAVHLRRNVEPLAAFGDNELAGADKLIGTLNSELKKMPADVAVRTAYTVGARLVRDGKWSEAREVFGIIVINYSRSPASGGGVPLAGTLPRQHRSPPPHGDSAEK